MCPSSVRHPSTGYDSFDEFGDHSTTNRQPYWFTPLLLLQSAVGQSTKVCYQQVAAGHECCSPCCERHKEVRPRLELHWLDVADRVTYKLGMTVYKCLHGQAPDYLSELYTPVAQVAERQHLRSASRHLLVVPRFQLDTYGRRTFAVAGPTT